MSRYLITFGRTPKLALAELKEVLKDEKYSIIFPFERKIYFETETPLDCNNLIHILGGTVKIAHEKAALNDSNNIPFEITQILSQKDTSKITFGITSWEKNIDGKKLSKEVKSSLHEKKILGRFVLSKTEDGISSVLIQKQNVIELQIINIDSKTIIFETIVVQEFEEWSRRDYQRPEINPKAGMLPPKVARMMINLAYQVLKNGKIEKRSPVLLDPFCGVGTIPMESAMMQIRFIAADQSKEMVEKSKKNIDWLKNTYKLTINSKFFTCDATHISEHVTLGSIDAIVTEPYLGPNFERIPTQENILSLIKGLEKLYIGCLKDWNKILSSKWRIVIILPKFRLEKYEISCKKAIDNCENIGYTLLSGPLEYAREQAIVAREIYILEKRSM